MPFVSLSCTSCSNYSHASTSGLCVKAVMENGVAKWTKTNCDDRTGKGVVCARRYNWEDIGKTYFEIGFKTCKYM